MTISCEPNAEGTMIEVLTSVDAVAREDWDTCSRAGGEIAYNPFTCWDFLRSLEEAGCAAARTGWLPQHLILHADEAPPRAIMPCYLKSHSQGEYVFDHAWADAYERAGGRYYPKLQASVPFTPASGRRLLTRDARDTEGRALLAAGLMELTRRHGASSAHVTFMTDEEADALERQGFLRRTDQQFHWKNDGYASFDDFLAALASRKRKAVKRERAEALIDGLEVEWVTGDDLREKHWDAFYRFYMDTGSRKWGRPYLNRLFFSLLGERMAQDVLLILARRDGRYVAGALNLVGGETLYGRYWGCIEHHPFLHFEICYYQAIDFAIERGLKRVEAGAQGSHKLARGYLPTPCHSAHYLPDPGFHAAVAEYLEHERDAVAHGIEIIAEQAPFKRSG